MEVGRFHPRYRRGARLSPRPHFLSHVGVEVAEYFLTQMNELCLQGKLVLTPFCNEIEFEELVKTKSKEEALKVNRRTWSRMMMATHTYHIPLSAPFRTLLMDRRTRSSLIVLVLHSDSWCVPGTRRGH